MEQEVSGFAKVQLRRPYQKKRKKEVATNTSKHSKLLLDGQGCPGKTIKFNLASSNTLTSHS